MINFLLKLFDKKPSPIPEGCMPENGWDEKPWKECPFCGSADEVWLVAQPCDNENGIAYALTCEADPPCVGITTDLYMDKRQLINHWNIRSPVKFSEVRDQPIFVW